MRAIQSEWKRMGPNPPLILLSVDAVFALASGLCGELLSLSCIGFEVIFPILTSIAVGEWGKLRADENYQVIAAQSPSLFRWIFFRFLAAFTESSLFALPAMAAAFLLRREMPLSEMLLLYLPPAFLLSTICVLLGMFLSQEHMAALFCGLFWLPALISQSLLRIPGVEYIYPFIRFAGDVNGIWLVNKAALCGIGLLLWAVVWRICRGR